MTTAEKTELNERQQESLNDAAKIEIQMETYLPVTDIVDNENEVRIYAELPGLDSDSVSITLDKNVLSIEGKYKEVPRPEGYSLISGEYPVGNYRRTFKLSQDFSSENIQAKMKDGILSLILPKRKEIGPKKVKVFAE